MEILYKSLENYRFIKYCNFDETYSFVIRDDYEFIQQTCTRTNYFRTVLKCMFIIYIYFVFNFEFKLCKS